MMVMRLQDYFCRAVNSGNVREARRILEEHPYLAKRRDCFFTAAKNCDSGILDLFISLGAEKHQVDIYGQTALNSAVTYGNYQAAEYLLQLGVNANQGCPLIDILSRVELQSDVRIKLCKLLLDYGADINQELRAIPGYNVLLKAMDYGDKELVRFLIANGAKESAEYLEADETPPLDLDTFQTRLESALRDAWSEVKTQRANETFCMFGLETDSDCVLLTPVCQTHEQIDREFPNRPDGDGYLKWARCSSDSPLYGAGSDHTKDLANELNQVYGQQETKRQFATRKKRVLEILQGALATLDSEGFFVESEQRKKVVIMLDIIDADANEAAFMKGVVSKLNPAEVWEEFFDSFIDA